MSRGREAGGGAMRSMLGLQRVARGVYGEDASEVTSQCINLFDATNNAMSTTLHITNTANPMALWVVYRSNEGIILGA